MKTNSFTSGVSGWKLLISTRFTSRNPLFLATGKAIGSDHLLQAPVLGSLGAIGDGTQLCNIDDSLFVHNLLIHMSCHDFTQEQVVGTQALDINDATFEVYRAL